MASAQGDEHEVVEAEKQQLEQAPMVPPVCCRSEPDSCFAYFLLDSLHTPFRHQGSHGGG